MKTSLTIGELSKALTKFQKSAPKITKDKKAEIGKYSYMYADLASIWDAIRGNLDDAGLSVIQSPTSVTGEPCLTTIIAHSSGEFVSDTMKLVITQDTPQGQGSAITYARRYQLSAMLGIVADNDNDAVDNRTASPINKKRIFEAAKKTMPELGDQPYEMVRFITEVVGKHPQRILEDEVDDAVNALEMYTAKALGA